MTDLVNHPAHYKSSPSGVEAIQVTEHLGFNLGSAMKYVWRCDDKGDWQTDLEKAIWYLNREIERRQKLIASFEPVVMPKRRGRPPKHLALTAPK